jgi:hypothetical protein
LIPPPTGILNVIESKRGSVLPRNLKAILLGKMIILLGSAYITRAMTVTVSPTREILEQGFNAAMMIAVI